MRMDVKEGMRVFTSDGVKLGTVVGCGEETFVVERGLLRLHDHVARYADVVEVRGGEVRLGLTKDQVEPGPHERPREEAEAHAAGHLVDSRELVIPLAYEEAEPRAVMREVGQVRIHKVVRTEVKHFSIPVRREELRVERVEVEAAADSGARAADGRTPPGGGAAFEESTLVIPLYEEQVELTKTARVWQEVTVSKTTEEELRQVHTPVRRETADVEERGEVLHEGPVDGLHS